MIFAGPPPHAQLEELTELPQTAELYLMGPTSKWREETKEGRGGKVREVDGSPPPKYFGLEPPWNVVPKACSCASQAVNKIGLADDFVVSKRPYVTSSDVKITCVISRSLVFASFARVSVNRHSYELLARIVRIIRVSVKRPLA